MEVSRFIFVLYPALSLRMGQRIFPVDKPYHISRIYPIFVGMNPEKLLGA
ncbi:hypothetical protein M2474_002101, partial [Dysgonomonas sp. PH5-37]|nr:hypothetical protein [Dysgonomonas sp. PH5-37]